MSSNYSVIDKMHADSLASSRIYVHCTLLVKYGLNINANAIFLSVLFRICFYVSLYFKSAIYIEHIDQIQVRKQASASIVRQTMFSHKQTVNEEIV